jgi:hypothetical protein
MTGRSFAHVLDAALDGVGQTSPASRAGIATAGLFAAPVGPWWRGVSAFRSASHAIPAPVPEPEPAETLLQPRTESERHALLRLQALGAGLPGAFTEGHLKRAFRRIARQIHPDGHPALSSAAHAALCRDFADARQAYDVLLAIGR